MNFEVLENSNSPIVCNVPYSGLIIPDNFKDEYKLGREELEDEVLYMADNYTDQLFSKLLFVSSFIKSNLSRLVVDIERFQDEEQEPMSKVGMSAFYTKTSNGDVLRDISNENRQLLQGIYQLYHSNFEKLVEQALEKYSYAIIVDCHSFASKPRLYELDKEFRPDICIGFEVFHSDPMLIKSLEESFVALGYSVKLNSPFTGSIVPTRYYQKDKRVISIMIEVNRYIYE